MKLSISVTTRAKQNAVVRWQDGVLKIRLKAPPVDGKANEALVEFLSDAFSVAKNQIHILSGHTSHLKLIELPITEKDLKNIPEQTKLI